MSELKITIEGTPNPDALKFVLDRQVQYNGSSTFLELSECEDIPLAKTILEINGVMSVFFMDHFVTVSKESGVPWDALTDDIEEFIRNNIEKHDPALSPENVDASKMPKSEQFSRIEEIIDQQIRPGLAADGGGLELLNYENNVLKVKYEGACGSCPSAKTGTLMAIQDLLRRTINDKIEVLAMDTPEDTAEDLVPFKSLFKEH